MSYQVGFWTDLNGLTFDEADDGMVSTFQAMPYGEYEHPVYGKIKLTLEKAQAMAKNIADKVRGTDLDIDYDHKMDPANGGKAAGWVQAADARPNGLYLTVKWTKAAWQAIKNGEYKYFSPEYHDEWTHPQTKTVHKDVLFGGGITNRPFLKDILPLNMSELFAEQQEKEGESGMDPKELRKKLGLPEDATDEQVSERLDAAAQAGSGGGDGNGNEGDPPEEGEGTEGEGEEGAQGQSQQVAASEGSIEEVIRLAETSTDPAVKALVGLVGGLHKQVETTTAALHLSETNNLVRKLSEPKEGVELSAGAQKALSETLLAPNAGNVKKLMEAIAEGGYITKGEIGGAGQHGEQDGTEAATKFNEAVDKRMKDNEGLQYADAVDAVALADPQLFAEYRQASYAFREN